MKLIHKPNFSYSHEIENKSFFSFLILLQKSEKRGWRRIPGREESKRREKFQRDSKASSLWKVHNFGVGGTRVLDKLVVDENGDW